MIIIHSYALAVFLCVITMLCWGSWANTQKLASKDWPFPLFYWDYVIGMLLCSFIFAMTFGSIGSEGRSFFPDLAQMTNTSFVHAFVGGVIFNIANLLLVAAIDVAGLAVAFPIGIGIALVLGVIMNYIRVPQGNPLFLFGGLGLICAAIITNAISYKKLSTNQHKTSQKGIILSIASGLLISIFYIFVAASMSLNLAHPEPGKLTPYTAFFIFSVGVFLSNFLWNTIFMYKPVKGTPVSYRDYFRGGVVHFVGVLGGIIWAIGMSLNLISSGKAGPAISYGLGQGATLIAAIWGVFIWKEFKKAPKGTNSLLALMFLFYVVGLILIIKANA